ncbi:MAG: imidazole glycerol phosphate synthase subunit HisH [Verrucomicrobia bacterium]|nr:imidazole glycerol phosphate synthase subunit HisH [Verrucomicrobiota bacterium]MDA1087917.1 imidazole glycerol phosphate synthase subunit HisH [Verrucomicrobiota bacterium]
MIAVIDYKAGNLTSVKWAFAALGVDAVVTHDPHTILGAERVVFPGVGAAGAAMQSLKDLGLHTVIRDAAGSGKPFLGICVGTQVLFDASEEDGGVECLGLMPGSVKRFTPSDPSTKVPQMGWNQVNVARPHPLLDGIQDHSEFYFVHSYYPDVSDASHCVAQTDYADVTFSSVVGRDNLVATQFHVEKSGRVGLRVLENFTRWNGSSC